MLEEMDLERRIANAIRHRTRPFGRAAKKDRQIAPQQTKSPRRCRGSLIALPFQNLKSRPTAAPWAFFQVLTA
jgi:hypothetical protein